jgi:BirA family transcriptional regulator, biotin operon repressor / biotin---[acetyl-CoA-carboxylase] ligase
MSTDAPRAPLDRKRISEEISQYWRVSVVDVTESTQVDLLQLVSSNEALSKQVIVSEYQSAGRGRLDRNFEAAPMSALTFSMYIEPKVDKAEWSFLTLLSALSVREAIASLDSTISVEVKWPNDLLIGEKKCAGIIAQAAEKGVVIGIGINVGMKEAELPVPTATSLAIEGSLELDRNRILAAILNHFEVNLQIWELGKSFITEYKEASATIGAMVEVTLPGGDVLKSKAIGITDAGELLLDSGEAVTVGDVVHLR